MSARVVVVGLGPAGAELITQQTAERLTSRLLWLRTARHPAAADLDAPSFDDEYDRADTFDQVYANIAARLIDLTREHGDITYAVPGSPRVLERSVENLLSAVGASASAGDVEVEVWPAMSFLDLAWVRLGVDPIEAGVRLVDGHRFAVEAAGATGALLVAHCHNQRVLSDIKLAFEDPPAEAVLIIQRLGLPDERIVEVPFADIDRSVEADHLTSLYIPALASPVGASLVAFDELIGELRAHDAWQLQQTHGSLAPYALEEASEVVEAIKAWEEAEGTDEEFDADDQIAAELGDLLLQIVLHARIATERGAFTLADVAAGIHAKMQRRHPLMFPTDGSKPKLDATIEEVISAWESAKANERISDT